ncbi:MaoC family dehydratase [Hoeflea sp.]|uniref:MaoC family dehydratase n=1 Tax=Hoeflea sp. TaxID=1940281 RepID=UPI003B52035E
MAADTLLSPGSRIEMGSHLFTAEDIIDFASRFDPQRFHVDAEAARDSVFGGLCASGWHTASVWMKLNVAAISRLLDEIRNQGLPVPEFGPSPGFRKLKWLRPVFAGDEIRYAQTVTAIRPIASRPGWSILEADAHAHNQAGEEVMSFQSAVMVRLP